MSLSNLAAALAAGVTIVTPNKRLARTLVARHDAAMVRIGHRTWPAAHVLPWSAWLTTLWRDACDAGAVAPGLRLLTSVESRYLWDRVVAADASERAPLLDPRGAAVLAADAWDLVHAWGSGGESWRGWHAGDDALDRSDPAHFAAWADRYRRDLGRLQGIDTAMLADVLAAAADAVADWHSGAIVLAGFIELTPQQRRLVDRLRAIGADIAEMQSVTGEASIVRFSATTPRDEIRAALTWARDETVAAPDRAIGIAIEDLAQRRDEVRALADDVLCPALQLPGNAAKPRPYNFSLGIPLEEAPIVGCALALITLAQRPLERAAAAALFRSPYLPGRWEARAQSEARWLDEGRAHVDWEHALSMLARTDAALGDRFRNARDRPHRLPQSPREWATQWRALLEGCGWPGVHVLQDHEFAARNAWEETLEDFARIGAIDAQMTAATALRTIRDVAASTVFAPPSAAAAISIMGVLEAAGLPFDALWISGLSAQRWPPAPQPNAFLPLAWQRERGVPRSSPARELDYGRALTAELARSAPYVVMSHPTTIDDQPSAASALIPAGVPLLTLAAPRPESAQTIRAAATMEAIADERAPPLPVGVFRGGAGAIAAQSDCPFRATARYRLRVEPWPAAAEGLNYMERGHLVHAAMAAFWRHTGSHAALVALDRDALSRGVDAAVDVARAVITPSRWRLLPPAVAGAEASRIAAIGMQWIESYERPRPPFVVTATEAVAALTLAGLTFNLRLDRIDALESGGSAIIAMPAVMKSPNPPPPI